ncbi:MAG: hypothetical protein HXS41_15370 [Theionarchaea archaeon]|nr:hypothetical protein [Theionarchaea archaeon]MBU7022430.1 hypothetical protein [Theionarchaea archaeon]MBU7035978.1 hypothetical protein [Theionarchaea archaeon]
MEKKRLSIAAVGIVVALLTIMFATATSLMADTPLFTLRMEQVSSKMSFLPTVMNGFTYHTENGYTFSNCAAGYCGGAGLLGTDATCHPTCDTCAATCPDTCYNTCPDTCYNTCPDTCVATCVATCPYTCDDPVTCHGEHTCQETCGYTCPDSCGGTCYGETECSPCPP